MSQQRARKEREHVSERERESERRQATRNVTTRLGKAAGRGDGGAHLEEARLLPIARVLHARRIVRIEPQHDVQTLCEKVGQRRAAAARARQRTFSAGPLYGSQPQIPLQSRTSANAGSGGSICSGGGKRTPRARRRAARGARPAAMIERALRFVKRRTEHLSP